MAETPCTFIATVEVMIVEEIDIITNNYWLVMYKSDDRKLDDDVFLSRVLCSVKKCQEMSERQSEINAPRNAWMSMI